MSDDVRGYALRDAPTRTWEEYHRDAQARRFAREQAAFARKERIGCTLLGIALFAFLAALKPLGWAFVAFAHLVGRTF